MGPQIDGSGAGEGAVAGAAGASSLVAMVAGTWSAWGASRGLCSVLDKICDPTA